MKHTLLIAALAAVMIAGSASAQNIPSEVVSYDWLAGLGLDVHNMNNVAAGVVPTPVGDYQRPGTGWTLGNLFPHTVGVGASWDMKSSDKEWIQIDLDGLYKIDSVTALFFSNKSYWVPATFRVMYSTDNVNYTYVTISGNGNGQGFYKERGQWAEQWEDDAMPAYLFNRKGSYYYSDDDQINYAYTLESHNIETASIRLAAVRYDFIPVEATSIRIVDVCRVAGEYIFSDMIVTGTKVPEPATMSLLALGGLALLRRRR